MVLEHTTPADLSPSPWSPDSLRSIRGDQSRARIYAPSLGLLQRVYFFDRSGQSELFIRRLIGDGLRYTSPSELIWVQAQAEGAGEVLVGVEPSYVFDRTEMLLTPSILKHLNGTQIAPLHDILEAVLLEVFQILKVAMVGISENQSPNLAKVQDCIVLDHKRRFQAYFVSISPSNSSALDVMESEAKQYCADFWTQRERMSKKVRVHFNLFVRPIRRHWRHDELQSLEVGDLLTLSQSHPGSGTANLSAVLRRPSNYKGRMACMAVQLQMSNQEVSVMYEEDLSELSESPNGSKVLSDEPIELDISAGNCKVPFDELCAVQPGMLIELSSHTLPMVTLCVNQVPLMEGELVWLKDQLMVQVTKRLD